eukprot:TRINITY_DN39565_c0_g1_i1.p1 TRINITY_DN39565_c0_g1~~TRINITY_DN39565_c0_g1_i1.p1  ORF type:complete len:378 (-),score=104.41 TRINITY_DN39565_c0_g1_i1:39-1172(-)
MEDFEPEPEKEHVPATEEEKKMLRSFAPREASQEERDGFLVKNAAFLSNKARGVFMDMSPTDQYRVIFDGPMKDSKDSVEILYARVKRFMDMESRVRALSGNANQAPKPKKAPSAKLTEISEQIAHSLANPTFEEVPESERRTAGVNQDLPEEKPNSALEGSVKGVGGVIEALAKKYGMQKGERSQVVAETKELWKLASEKTVPKPQVNVGWKWVLKNSEAEAKKAAEEAARKKAAKEEAEKKKKEEEGAAKKKNEVKSKKRKDSSESSEEVKKKKEKKGKESSKAKSKKRKNSSESSEEAAEQSEESSRSPSRSRKKSGRDKDRDKRSSKKDTKKKETSKKRRRSSSREDSEESSRSSRSRRDKKRGRSPSRKRRR